MKHTQTTLAAMTALVFITGCSQESEVLSDQERAAGSSAPAGPGSYAAAEMQMVQQMAVAQGANPYETWTRKMIEHHRGAIAMADILLAGGGDPQVLAKARMAADAQRKEIAELEALLPPGDTEAPLGKGENPFAQAVSQMHQRMMAAGGSDPSETWVRKMIEHHRGGAEMSNVLLALTGDPKVREKARMTRQSQLREAGELERMLGGEAAPAEKSMSGAAPPPTSRPGPQPEPEAGGTTTSSEAVEQPAADPHAGHDMSEMSD